MTINNKSERNYRGKCLGWPVTSFGGALGYPNIEKRVENTTRSGVFFNEIRGVWIADETLSLVFDISSQSKQN